MCNVYCCCSNTQITGLIRLLFIFTTINLIISFAAIFIRAAGTKRYETALTYLESMNNGLLITQNIMIMMTVKKWICIQRLYIL